MGKKNDKSTRRGNGEGSIMKVEGRKKPYRARMRIDGKMKTIGYFDTKEEARKEIRRVATEIDNNTYVEPSKLRLSDWLAIWIEDYCTNLKHGTEVLYRGYAKNHIIPALGSKRLNDLTPDTIQRFVNRIQRRSGKEKPLAAKTIKNIFDCLNGALEQAVAIKYLKDNPAAGCKLPINDDEVLDADVKPFNDADVHRILAEALRRDDRFTTIYRFALGTGMRLSEIIGLSWDKVDLETGITKVEQQLTMQREKGDVRRIAATKSRNHRTFKIPPSVVDLLKEQQATQQENKRLAGELWDHEYNLIFTDEIGHTLPHSSIEHRFRRILDSLGMYEHCFHDLRHTFAVKMLRLGVDVKSVSKILGHRDAAFTLRVYCDFTADMRDAAAEKMQVIMDMSYGGGNQAKKDAYTNPHLNS